MKNIKINKYIFKSIHTHNIQNNTSKIKYNLDFKKCIKVKFGLNKKVLTSRIN